MTKQIRRKKGEVKELDEMLDPTALWENLSDDEISTMVEEMSDLLGGKRKRCQL